MWRGIWFVLMSVGLLLGGCDLPLSREGGLSMDVLEVLQAQGLMPQRIECQSIGRTRDGFCTLAMTPAEAETLIAGAKLLLAEVEDVAFFSMDGCGALPEFDVLSPSVVWMSGRRASQLTLKNGSAFELLLLYHRADLGRACLRVSYSYG